MGCVSEPRRECAPLDLFRDCRVVNFAQKNQVVVNSFCLGDEDNQDLRVVSYLSGGYKFAPDSLEEAMGICEMGTCFYLMALVRTRFVAGT